MDLAAKVVPPVLVRTLVGDYLAAWNEPDPGVRLSLLDRCWDDAGVYLDPTVYVEGRAALSTHIAGVQAKRPGAHLELVSGLDHHHAVVRFLWRVVRPGQPKGPVSTDIGEIGAGGVLVRMTGFFGSP